MAVVFAFSVLKPLGHKVICYAATANWYRIYKKSMKNILELHSKLTGQFKEGVRHVTVPKIFNGRIVIVGQVQPGNSQACSH